MGAESWVNDGLGELGWGEKGKKKKSTTKKTTTAKKTTKKTGGKNPLLKGRADISIFGKI